MRITFFGSLDEGNLFFVNTLIDLLALAAAKAACFFARANCF